MAEKKYTVTSPVRHGGKLYQIGEEITLGDEHVEQVIHCVEPVKAKAAPAAASKDDGKGEAKDK